MGMHSPSQWHSGRQVLYVYVNTDLLVLAGDSEGEPSGGNSGLSSAFLRALAIDCGTALFVGLEFMAVGWSSGVQAPLDADLRCGSIHHVLQFFPVHSSLCARHHVRRGGLLTSVCVPLQLLSLS